MAVNCDLILTAASVRSVDSHMVPTKDELPYMSARLPDQWPKFRGNLCSGLETLLKSIRLIAENVEKFTF